MRRKVLLPCLVLLVSGCDDRPKSWTAFVYPDGSNLQSSIEMGGFKSFQQCQVAAIRRLRALDDPDQGDYECGYRCEWRPDMGLNVCKETRQ